MQFGLEYPFRYQQKDFGSDFVIQFLNRSICNSSSPGAMNKDNPPPLQINITSELISEIGHLLRNKNAKEDHVRYFNFSLGYDSAKQQLSSLVGIDIRSTLADTLRLLGCKGDAAGVASTLLHDANNNLLNHENSEQVANKLRQERIPSPDISSLQEALWFC